MIDADLQRRAAHERRVLLRSPDPLVAAAIKLAEWCASVNPGRHASDCENDDG